MAKADALFWREDHVKGIEEGNKGILLSHQNKFMQCQLGSWMLEMYSGSNPRVYQSI